jgi:two-component system, LytTR family, response regulator
MLRAIIIDDETPSRNRLKKLLKKCCPEVMVAGEASGVISGMIAVQEFKPDLVLLATRLKDGSGFDFLRLLHSSNFKVIFMSANDKAAFKAFKFNPVDYLIKPVNPDELAGAVKRAGLPFANCRQ